MHRRLAKARLKAGLTATVSALALIMRLPTEASLAQEGTRPQRTTRSSRACGWSSRAGLSTTA